MSVRSRWGIVGVAVLLVGVILVLLSGPMAPIKEGTSAGFWKRAVAVDVGSEQPDPWLGGGIYPPREGWYIYYLQHFHGQWVFRVKREQAVADYPEALRLVRSATDDNEASRVLRRAIRVARSHDAQTLSEPETFFELMRGEALVDWADDSDMDFDAFRKSNEELFDERWRRARRYWANVLFEFVFFSGLIVFALWPWLRKKGLLAWSVHLALVPVLLFLPTYFGYCTWTYTSHGPSGGVLYPLVIVWFGGFPLWTDVDTQLVQAAPQVLEPLSQPAGPWLSISSRGAVAPSATLLFGCILAAAPFICFLAQRLSKWRNRRRGPEGDDPSGGTLSGR